MSFKVKLKDIARARGAGRHWHGPHAPPLVRAAGAGPGATTHRTPLVRTRDTTARGSQDTYNSTRPVSERIRGENRVTLHSETPQRAHIASASTGVASPSFEPVRPE
eukprot:4000534-Prymnesium_polylepis.1